MANGINAPCATPRPNPAVDSPAKLARTTRGITTLKTTAITANGNSFINHRRAGVGEDEALPGVANRQPRMGWDWSIWSMDWREMFTPCARAVKEMSLNRTWRGIHRAKRAAINRHRSSRMT